MSLQHQLEQLRTLDDDSLLRSLERHVGSSNRLNALVLAHLAEVDARGAHRQWACDTLAAYCVYELRLSENEAQRRCRAVRVARQFPVLFDMLADASIHLTGILLLAPYLTDDNHLGLLARARYRRKREIERLVAELAPARDVPALIEPLGIRRDVTAPARPRNTWAAITAGSMGWVRELKPGDRPTDAPSASDEWHDTWVDALDAESDAPERARRVLWHQLPSGDLVQLQRLALEALVEKLMRRKCGAPARPATPQAPRTSKAPATSKPAETSMPTETSKPSETSEHPDTPAPTPRPTAPARSSSLQTHAETVHRPPPPSASRHIPSAVRRSVWQRDGGRCTFVDDRGVRCRATGAIEFHHSHPHARGGPPTVANISLRCRSHNELAAEPDFGRDLVLAMKPRERAP